jgi:hypothetical protein
MCDGEGREQEGGPRNTRGPGTQFCISVFVFSTNVSSLAVVVVVARVDSGAGVIAPSPTNAAGARVARRNYPRASENISY